MARFNRPAYVERKIALERQRREALRSHPKPCDCWACITPQRRRELLDAALARNGSSSEEIPF